MKSEPQMKTEPAGQPVSKGELNSWRRGFTPQAEIWNGRMAMFGLAAGFWVLFLTHKLIGS